MFFDLPIDMINEVMKLLLSFDIRNVLINLVLLKKLHSSNQKILENQIKKEKECIRYAHNVYGCFNKSLRMNDYRKLENIQINQYFRSHLAIDLSDDRFYLLYWRSINYFLSSRDYLAKNYDPIFVSCILDSNLTKDIIYQIIENHPSLIHKLFRNNKFRSDARTFSSIIKYSGSRNVQLFLNYIKDNQMKIPFYC